MRNLTEESVKALTDKEIKKLTRQLLEDGTKLRSQEAKDKLLDLMILISNEADRRKKDVDLAILTKYGLE